MASEDYRPPMSTSELLLQGRTGVYSFQTAYPKTAAVSDGVTGTGPS